MIYLHLLLKNESTVHVCKDTSHMDAMGHEMRKELVLMLSWKMCFPRQK